MDSVISVDSVKKETLFELGTVHPSKLELHTETKARLDGGRTDLQSARPRQRSSRRS
jgi:hypothetical protein